MATFEELAQAVIRRLASDAGAKIPVENAAENPVDNDEAIDPAFEWLQQLHIELEGQAELLPPDRIAEEIDIPELTEAERQSIREGLAVGGLETLAFYKSIHFLDQPPFPGKWGIFILDQAVVYLADELMAQCTSIFPRRELRRARQIVTRFLYDHEFFHFRVDAWSILHEAFTGRQLYTAYFSNYYKRHFPSNACFEESLANWYTFDRTVKQLDQCVQTFLRDWVELQPPCYSNWERDRDDTEVWLMQAVLRGKPFPWLLDDRLGFEPPIREFCSPGPITTIAPEADCPSYRISGVKASKLSPPQIVLPDLKEVEHFIVKYLNGTLKGATDHQYYVIDNGESVKMPNPHSKQAKLAEFANILHKAGLSRPEYFEERERTRVWKKNVPRTTPRIVRPS